MIKLWFSNVVIKIFGCFGLTVEKYLEPRKILDFVELISPFTTEVELIRIGGEDDGGYLIPNDLQGVIALFSPGVAETATFELEIANQGINCYLADYSVERSPYLHEKIYFDKIFIGTEINEQFTTLTEWINSKGLPEVGDYILQMDIEGGEYEVILSTSFELLSRFRVLVIEFHFLDKIATYFGNRMISQTFSKLKSEFEIAHIHPNNCCAPVDIQGVRVHPCIEVTFIRRDRFNESKPTLRFPHPLDRPNLKRKRDYPFEMRRYSV